MYLLIHKYCIVDLYFPMKRFLPGSIYILFLYYQMFAILLFICNIKRKIIENKIPLEHLSATLFQKSQRSRSFCYLKAINVCGLRSFQDDLEQSVNS